MGKQKWRRKTESLLSCCACKFRFDLPFGIPMDLSPWSRGRLKALPLPQLSKFSEGNFSIFYGNSWEGASAKRWADERLYVCDFTVKIELFSLDLLNTVRKSKKFTFDEACGSSSRAFLTSKTKGKIQGIKKKKNKENITEFQLPCSRTAETKGQLWEYNMIYFVHFSALRCHSASKLKVCITSSHKDGSGFSPYSW